MKTPFKIVLINVILVIVFSILLGFEPQAYPKDYLATLGLVTLAVAVLNFFAGIFLLLKTDKSYAQGTFLSAGLLLLFGYVLCSSII